MTIELPESPFITRTFDTILAEMLAEIPETMDKSVGSYIWDALAPVAAHIADDYLKADFLRQSAFLETATGEYLDLRAEEHGVERNQAEQALVDLLVTGLEGTLIPAGTQFSTLSDPNSATGPIVFVSTTQKQIQPRRGNGTWQETDPSIVYTGVWNISGAVKQSLIINDTAEIFYNGTSITVRLITGPAQGKVGWKLDGGSETIVDLYAVGTGTQDIVIGSAAGNHNVLLRVETKNASSSANNVGIDYYTVTGGDTVLTDTVVVPTQALEGGAEANVGSGTITHLVSTLSGLTAITNPLAASGGDDIETDTEFRERFKEIVANPPNSGNKAHYVEWAKEASVLVGNAYVQPLWAGAGTVKVFVVDKDNNPASAPIVAEVQAYIDPAPAGTGAGKAPIGATVTAIAPTGVPIDVNVTLLYDVGFDPVAVRAAVTLAINEYLVSLAIADTIRFADLFNTIHDVEGILDLNSLQFRRDAAAFAATNIVLAAGEKAIPDVYTYA